ncbi:MAG: DNA-processing protein DprA [Synergistaceae bacterium]|nr:DNA-processing protein DprA [Synergistaceae bacterium]
MNAAQAPADAFLKLCEGELERLYWGEAFWKELGVPPAAQTKLARLLAERDWPERELERVERAGARFVCIHDGDYPPQLKDLDRPPLGLYVRGKMDCLSLSRSVAVVGTRKCDFYGQSQAEELGRKLAQAGFTVVSGGARGIDAAGHRGCLAGGGVTAVVFGTGIDKVYPVEHRDLFERIAHAGVLISEYPMGSSGEPWRFPERNRVIVGLSERTVVVESPEDGGAMITARLALDIGREVWAVPGRITDVVCEGTNLLIRDGALVLNRIDDFVEHISGYGQLTLKLDVASTAPAAPPPNLSTDEKIVLELLNRQGNRTMDSLLSESGLNFAALQTCLMSLLAKGLASENAGRWSEGSLS